MISQHELKKVQLQERYTLVTQDSIGHLKTLCMSVLSLVVALESEWKRYSSSQSDEKNASVQVWIQLKGELHPKPNLSTFSELSQNYQHCFEKQYKHPEANCLRNSKISIKILVGQTVLELLITTIYCMFWSVSKELLGLLNFNVIFEFLGQFALRCLYHIAEVLIILK